MKLRKLQCSGHTQHASAHWVHDRCVHQECLNEGTYLTALQMNAVTGQLTAVAAITTNVQHRKDNRLVTDQVR